MFRKSLLLLTFLAASLFSFGQNPQYSLKVDSGIGGAMTIGNLMVYGIDASTEGKFFITPLISAGVRLEGAVMLGGNLRVNDENLTVGVSARSLIAGKVEYYLQNDRTTPFFGIIAGRYTQANFGGNGSGDVLVTGGNYFGFAPEAGITFNNFRISAMYHIIPGRDQISLAVGDPVRVRRDYFVLQFGFKIWGLEM